MPISNPPRPTFLLRRTLEWLGGAVPQDFTARTNTGLDEVVRTSAAVKEWWSALEPLILVLTLAGYECPELVVVKAGQSRGYLRLPAWEGLDEQGLIAYADAEWDDDTGVTNAQLGGAWAATLLRVEVRRTIDTPVRRAYDQPPRFAPLPLDGVLAGIGAATGDWPRYAVHPVPDDVFADPADGWVVFKHLSAVTDAMAIPKLLAREAPAARDAVLDALIDAWEAAGPDVGIVRALDPASWTSPVDRATWVWPFDELVARMWQAIGQGSALRTQLRLPLDEKGVSFRAMAELVAPGLDAELGDDSREAAVRALKERYTMMRIEDATLEPLLDSLSPAWSPPLFSRTLNRHWILVLFALHEYSLVRLLPFAMDYEPGIAYADLTGWYEGGVDAFNAPDNAALQLNQAGNRLIGWFQDAHLERWDIDAEMVAYDPGDDGATLGYAVPGAGPGEVSAIDLIPRADPTEMTVRVIIDPPPGGQTSRTHGVVRRHRYPLIPPPTVVAAVGDDVPADLATQLLPLHSRAQRAVDRAAGRMKAEIREMRNSPREGWDFAVNSLANELKDILEDGGVALFDTVYDDNQQPVTIVRETKMLARFRLMIQKELRGTTIIEDVDDGDGLSQLREILVWVDEDDALPGVKLLSDIVGVAPAPHQYEFWMGELGPTFEANLIAGGWYGGALTPTQIDHKASCGNGQAHGWTEYYVGVLGQAGISFSSDVRAKVGFISVSTGNDLAAALEWTPEDFVFPSWFIVGETSWEFSITPGWGFKFGPSLATGDEYEAYTFFSSRGWATGQGDGQFISVAVVPVAFDPKTMVGLSSGPFGVGWSPIGGKIGALIQRYGLTDSAPPPPPPPQPPGLPLNMTIERTVGFAFDSAELDDVAKADIARIVARHRQLLEWSHSRLEIEGDASEEGPDKYNDRLSWERALAVYRHVMSLLSTPASIDGWWGASNAFAVRESRIELLGNGEMKQRYSTQKLPNSDWRRCKLSISGQVLVLI